MPGPGLITGYLDALAGQLPGPVVEELADGLEETCRRHLGLGMAPDAAAQAAVAEFGDPELIAAEFARAHPARRAARRLLVTGPAVGLCWAVALVTGRAWTWPVPMAADLVPGLALVAVVALLAFAARGTRYRPIGRAGAAGCIGTAALDTFMIIGVLAADPAARWAVAVAMTASAARLALNVRLVRPVLAGNGLHDRAAALDQGRPVRRAGHEGGVPLLDPGLADREHGGGMGAGHRLDPRSRTRGWHGVMAGPRG